MFADADLEKFARESPYSVFDNGGQDCCARSRILVERSVHERVVELFADGDPERQGRRSGRRGDRGRHARQLQAARPGHGLHRDRAGRGRDDRRRRRGAGRSGPGRWRVPDADRLRRRVERHADRRARRSSGRSCRSSRSTPRRRRSGSPTRRRTACPARSGAATSARRCGRPRRSRPGVITSTRTARSTPRRRSAATRCRASGASSGCRALELYTETKNVFIDLS